jgi:hypothetical protein
MKWRCPFTSDPCWEKECKAWQKNHNNQYYCVIIEAAKKVIE